MSKIYSIFKNVIFKFKNMRVSVKIKTPFIDFSFAPASIIQPLQKGCFLFLYTPFNSRLICELMSWVV